MPDDGTISPEKLIVEVAALLINKIKEKYTPVSFRLIRQSNNQHQLTPQDKRDILALYQAMLDNPQIKKYHNDMNSYEDMESYLNGLLPKSHLKFSYWALQGYFFCRGDNFTQKLNT